MRKMTQKLLSSASMPVISIDHSEGIVKEVLSKESARARRYW